MNRDQESSLNGHFLDFRWRNDLEKINRVDEKSHFVQWATLYTLSFSPVCPRKLDNMKYIKVNKSKKSK